MSDSNVKDQQTISPTAVSDVTVVTSVSFDAIDIETKGGSDSLSSHVANFIFSARDSNDAILERFTTQLALDMLPRWVSVLNSSSFAADFLHQSPNSLQGVGSTCRALTPEERLVLLFFGLVHANYVQLPLLPVVQKLKVSHCAACGMLSLLYHTEEAAMGALACHSSLYRFGPAT
jgi:hypothetical protein